VGQQEAARQPLDVSYEGSVQAPLERQDLLRPALLVPAWPLGAILEVGYAASIATAADMGHGFGEQSYRCLARSNVALSSLYSLCWPMIGHPGQIGPIINVCALALVMATRRILRLR